MKTDNLRIVIWGYKNRYHTHGHIHEALYRALKFQGRDVFWLDEENGLDVDSRTMFISQNNAAVNIPVVRGALYLIHNFFGGNAKTEERLKNSNVLHFGVKTDRPSQYAERAINIYWATDLLPYEIRENMAKAQLLNERSRSIHWVGTMARDSVHENASELNAFAMGAKLGGMNVYVHGADGTVSISENIRLVQESYMAPAIVGPWQRDVGYIPCRIFKNISYGHFGVTNSEAVDWLFQGRLLRVNSDIMFEYAQARLRKKSLDELHSLMNYVAENHTYLNRIEQLFYQAEKLI